MSDYCVLCGAYLAETTCDRCPCMLDDDPPQNRVSMDIVKCTGQGISVATVLDSFKRMKAELEALNCQVNMTVNGLPIDALDIEEIPESEAVK